MTMMARRWQVAAKTQVLFFWLVVTSIAWGAAEPLQSEFPIPKELEPNVAFWKRVYSEWTTEQIAFSDDEDLSMVYKVIDVPPDTTTASRKARSQKIKETKEDIREALAKLDGLKPQSEWEVTGLARELFLALKNVKRDDKFRRMDFVRAQNGLKNRFEEGYFLSGAHEKEIRLRLKEAGLPEDLIAVVFVESLFHSRAMSHAGAGGIWQFMKGTAREFMRVNNLVDERFDPILATDAAIQYMKSARASLEAWPLIITSYNYGRNGMVRAMNQVGSKNFGDILAGYDHDRFGFAARNYYAEFLAALEIYRDAKRYFPDAEQTSPWEYDVVTIENPIFLRDLTKHKSSLVSDVQELNPALTQAVKAGKEVLPSGFVVRVPKDKRAEVLAVVKQSPNEEKRRAENLVRARHRANGRQTLAQIAGLYDVFYDSLAERLGLTPKMKPKRGTIVSVRSAESRFTPIPEPLYQPKLVAKKDASRTAKAGL